MATRKIRNSWWVDFRWACTRYRKRSPVNTRSGAAQYELELRARILRGEPIDDAPRVALARPNRHCTFTEFAEQWFATYVTANNKLSEQQAKRYTLRRHIAPWFGSFRLAEITTHIIEQFKGRQLAAGLSRKTVNNQLAILRKSLQCAVDWDMLDRIPHVQLLRIASPPFRVLSRQESDRLWQDVTEPQWNLMARLALRTGMRRGELMALHWKDVDFVRNRVTVRQSAFDGELTDTKTYRVRYIPLASDIRRELQQIIEPASLVFPSRTGSIYSDSGADKAIRRIGQRLEIPELGWHTLRHTFATDLAASGVPLHVVKELLGHSSITMTMRYAHVAPSMLDDAIATLERQCANSGQPAGNFLQRCIERAPASPAIAA